MRGISIKPRLHIKSFPLSSVGKESACNVGDPGSIPGLGGFPGEGNGKPLKYSCLVNPIDRGAWQASVHRVAGVGQELATTPPPRLLTRLGRKYSLKAL